MLNAPTVSLVVMEAVPASGNVPLPPDPLPPGGMLIIISANDFVVVNFNNFQSHRSSIGKTDIPVVHNDTISREGRYLERAAGRYSAVRVDIGVGSAFVLQQHTFGPDLYLCSAGDGRPHAERIFSHY
jgi:hypothetical protein